MYISRTFTIFKIDVLKCIILDKLLEEGKLEVSLLFQRFRKLRTKKKLIDINSSTSFIDFKQNFQEFFYHVWDEKEVQRVIVLCIGTDRSTGDCFGPLVGTKLKESNLPGIKILGDLDNPVHAKNLKSTIKAIKLNHSNALIVAVDACLGKPDHVGYVEMGLGPLKPGAGVKKDLPPVGNLYVSGIVNIGGFMEYLVLQNTRLSTVMKMANLVSHGLSSFFRNYLDPVSSKL